MIRQHKLGEYMMAYRVSTALLVFSLFFSFQIGAAEKNATTPGKNNRIKLGEEYDGIVETIPPKKINWAQRVKFGSKGNVTVYVDKDNVPTAVYVVGVAPVSTTMVAVEAEEDAMEEAEFNAKAAFALWMHECFTVETVRERKRMVVRTNGKENSESISISKSKASQVASGQWRGMSVFWHKREKGRYIVVWRWSVSEQRLAQLVEILTRDGNPAAVGTERHADHNVAEIEGEFRR